MICPECRAWADVKETRKREDGSKYRRYMCANGHRFSTREVAIPGYKKKSRD